MRMIPAASPRAASARQASPNGTNEGRPDRAGRLRALAARTWAGHRLFIVVLIPAALLRLDAELGYRWQAWFNDSFEYLSYTVHFQLDPERVSGYSVLLKLLEPFHSYALITIVQHLMGLAVAVMVYALARRYGAPAWLATLATVPVLYDGFEIELEHLIMPDVPFLFLLTAATTLLLWDRSGPSLAQCAGSGLLLGIADTVREVALPLLPIFAVYMIIRRIGWRKLAAIVVACAIPLLGYASVFDLEHGQFAMNDATGIFIYSRVMTFAECSTMHVPADELWLCDTTPPDHRPIAQDYIWDAMTPLDRYAPSQMFSPVPNALAENFAIRAIEAQPLDYLTTVLHGTARVFVWNRYIFPNAQTYDEYLFRSVRTPIPSWDDAHLGKYDSYAAAYAQGNPNTEVVNPFALVIRDYQRYVWLPGTVYGLILLAGLGGIALAWRRWGGEALLPWALSLALIVIPAATAEFDYRYVLPAVPFGCLAAAMAFSPGTAGGDLARKLAARARKHRAGGS